MFLVFILLGPVAGCPAPGAGVRPRGGMSRPGGRPRPRCGKSSPAGEFIGFGDIHGPKPYEFIGFGAMDVTKPYDFYTVWGHGCHQTL